MPVTLSQYRGALVGGVSSQFVPNKQYNFFYSDSFGKLNIPAVSSVSFLTFIYVYEVTIPNGLPSMFLLRKY